MHPLFTDALDVVIPRMLGMWKIDWLIQLLSTHRAECVVDMVLASPEFLHQHVSAGEFYRLLRLIHLKAPEKFNVGRMKETFRTWCIRTNIMDVEEDVDFKACLDSVVFESARVVRSVFNDHDPKATAVVKKWSTDMGDMDQSKRISGRFYVLFLAAADLMDVGQVNLGKDSGGVPTLYVKIPEVDGVTAGGIVTFRFVKLKLEFVVEYTSPLAKASEARRAAREGHDMALTRQRNRDQYARHFEANNVSPQAEVDKWQEEAEKAEAVFQVELYRADGLESLLGQ